jgi:hypothetical protein
MKIRAIGGEIRGQLRLARARAMGKTVVRFLHIRKTGGTAIRETLGRWHETDTHLFTFHNHNYRLRDAEPWAQVAFVYRDPVARYVSGFNGRKRQGLPRYHYPWSPEEAEAFARFETPEALALALDGPPADRAAAEAAMAGIRHLRHRYDYWFDTPETVAANAPRIAFAGRQESLTEDFARLTARARLGALRLPEDAVAAHRGTRPAPLSERARTILTEWHAEDYRFVAAFDAVRDAHIREAQNA